MGRDIILVGYNGGIYYTGGDIIIFYWWGYINTCVYVAFVNNHHNGILYVFYLHVRILNLGLSIIMLCVVVVTRLVVL